MKHFPRTIFYRLSSLSAAWLLALAVCMLPAFAQDTFVVSNRVEIHGGMSAPVGNFSALPSTLQDLIPQQGRVPLGAANLGFTIGLTDIVRLTPNLGLVFTLDGAYNPYNTVEAERQLRSGIANLSVGGVNLALISALLQTSVAYTAQPYINGTLMGGVRYELPIIAGAFSIFAMAQGGLFYGVLPATEAKLSLAVPLVNIRADGSVSQTAGQAAALGYGVGAGVVLFDRVTIGARYTGASPEFSTDIKPVITTSGVPGSVMVPGLGQVNIQSLLNTALGVVPQSATRFAFPVSTMKITVGVIL
ncbi:MAG: hypothetical protein EAZ92_00270 [Candidatus Kapaibacterium sp.]|nr:MAG: hypothetical protein EAZ92_00270 [Candidatus Kapabacteria bacterium]